MNGWHASFKTVNWQKYCKNLLLALTFMLQAIHLGQDYLTITRNTSAHKYKIQRALAIIKQNYSLNCQVVITLSQIKRSRRKNQSKPLSAKE